MRKLYDAANGEGPTTRSFTGRRRQSPVCTTGSEPGAAHELVIAIGARLTGRRVEARDADAKS